jgi:hypothetical protein
MDSQKPQDEIEGEVEENLEPMEEEEEEDFEEYEVTREELVDALHEVVANLSAGLKGEDRDSYLDADDLAQNDWFYAGISDEEGMYAVTMWRAEGEEHELRVDIGTEDDVHALAANPEEAAAIVDDFIEAMSEDYEEYLDEEDDEDEEYAEDDEEDEEDEGEFVEEEELEEFEEESDDSVRQNGNRAPR